MKVIIIEDEQLSAEHLVRLLHKIDPSIQVIAQLDSVEASLAAFHNGLTADFMLVDIHLADGSSFDLFSQISIDIPVIFTTAFDQYAIQAFQLNSIAYLLKPIDGLELSKALNKLSKWTIQEQQRLIGQIQQLHASPTYKQRFLVKLGDQIHSIKTNEIHHFISEDGMVFLVNSLNKRFPVDFTLDQLESLLQPEQFFRINRKVILHIDGIQKISSFFNSRLKIQTTHLNGDETVVSRERVNAFKEWLNQ